MRRNIWVRLIDKYTVTHTQVTTNMGYDWTIEPQQYKRVILCNLEKYKSITRKAIIDTLKSSPIVIFAEWEPFMSELLVGAIDEAYKQNLIIADVTEMFSFNIITWLEGAGNKIAKQEKIKGILLQRLFDIVNETDEELRVNIKSGIIK